MKNTNIKIKYLQNTILSLVLALSVTATAFASDITKDNIYQELNQERAAKGIGPLKINSELDNAANLKSKDMINRDYFEHYAYGLSPWDFISISGYDYLYAGENLAMDFATSEGMIKAWMNSPAHKENILNPEFKEIGIGVVKGAYTENGKTHQTTMVTTVFGTPKPTILKIIDKIINWFVPFR